MNDWSTAEQHAERAWRYYESGRWEQALRELDRALAFNQDQAEWWFARGLTLDALTRFEEAVTAYLHVIDMRSDDVEAWLHLGIDYIRTRQATLALHALEQAQHLAPDNPTSYCHRIAAYAQMNDHDNAEVMFYLALQLDEDCPVTYDHMAHSLASRGEMERAVWCWHRVLDLDVHHPEISANLARAYWFLGKLERARHCYERHLREHCDDMDARVELAAMIAETDRLEEAVEQLVAVLATHPGHTSARHLMGDLSMKLNKPTQARKHYREALDTDHTRAGLHLGLAMAARELDEPETATHHLLKELEVGGQDENQVLQLARMLVSLEQSDHAIALLTPVVDGFDDVLTQNDQAMAEALQIRGVAMAAIGQHEQAIADCRRAVRLDRGNTRALQQLVAEYLRLDQFDRAQVCLNRAIELAPDDRHLRQLASNLKWHRLTHLATRVLRRAA